MAKNCLKFYLLILLVKSVHSIAERRNKAFGKASLVSPPALLTQSGRQCKLESATDGIMTRWEPDNAQYWSGYLFSTAAAQPGDSRLEINIGPSTIRTILISTREIMISPYGWPGWSSIGMRISIGDTLATSTTCFTFLSGYSIWFTCNGSKGLTGSKIFLIQTVYQYITLYELQAFDQFNIILNCQINGYTTPSPTSSPNYFLKQDMRIQNGDASSCYLSQFANQPFISLAYKAVIQFTTVSLVGMIPKTNPPPANSDQYSSNLVVEIYKFGILQGTCTPLIEPFDPLLDAEQDCNNIVGDAIKIYRQCPTTPCQLGLCGGLVLSDCDCSKTRFDPDQMGQLYYSGQIMNVTKIEIELFGQGVYIKTKFAQFNDSTSLVCGNTIVTKFCGNRMPTIWDVNLNAEIDLSISTLFQINIATGVLTVQTNNLLDVGTRSYKFGVKLSDYPAAAYFPPDSEFTVQVNHTTTIYPNFETNYTYTIGSLMTPRVYTVFQAVGTTSITVNGDDINIESTYGVILSQETSGNDILIYITSLYFENDLANKKLQIILTFTQSSNKSYTFPIITATYLNDNTPPFFKVTRLPESLTIPCLTSRDAQNWEYKFPPVSDKQHDNIKLEFECPELANIVFLNQQKMLLQLNSQAGFQQPASGHYKSVVILSDSNLASQSYELDLTVYCLSKIISADFTRSDFQNKTKNQTSIAKPPIPSIQEITSSGVIRIHWDQNMKISFDLPILQTSNVLNGKVRLPPSNYLKKLLQVKIIQRSDPEVVQKEKLNFLFSFEWVNSTTSNLNVRFDNPVDISSGKIKDQMEIVFNTSDFLMSASAPYHSVQQNFTLKIDIPRQLSPNSYKIDAQTISRLSVSLLWTSVITGILFGGVISAILSFLPIVVLIVHMFASSLNFPVNLQEFLSGLFPLVTIDILPTDYIYEQIFGFSNLQDSPMSDQFGAIGYNYTLSVRNLQSLFIFIILQPVLTLVLYVINQLLLYYKQKNRWIILIQKRISLYQQYMIWNGFIQFYQQNCLAISIIALIQFTQLKLNYEHTSTEKFCSSLAIILYTNTWLLPIVILILYVFNIRSSIPLPDLNDQMDLEEIKYLYNTIDIERIKKNAYTQKKHKKIMKKFGEVIRGIKLDQLKKRLTFLIGFLPFLRQIVLSFGVVYFRESPIFLIFLFNTSSLIVIGIIVHYQPYQDKIQQDVKVLQEIGLLFINYQLFCFTGWADPEAAVFVGNCTIFSLITEIAIFFIIGITPLIQQQILILKRCHYRKQMKNKKKPSMKETLKILKEKHAPRQVKPVNKFQNENFLLQLSKPEIMNQTNYQSVSESVEMTSQMNDSEQSNPSSVSSYHQEEKSKQLSRNLFLDEALQSYAVSEELENIEVLAAKITKGVQEDYFDEAYLQVNQEVNFLTFRNATFVEDQVAIRYKQKKPSQETLQYS